LRLDILYFLGYSYLRNNSDPLSRPCLGAAAEPQNALQPHRPRRSHLGQAGQNAPSTTCMAVDEGHGFSHIQADFADRRDSVLRESIVAPLHQRLLTHDLPVREVVADTNYSNGVNYALLEARGITLWIPVFGKYKPATKSFTYDVETDCFTCLAGKPLPSKAFDKNQDRGLRK
jgi:hypothetical protein